MKKIIIKNAEIDTLFPVAIYDALITDEELLLDIEREIYRLKEEYPDGELISNYGGWQSPRNAWWDGTSPLLGDLGNELLPHVKNYYWETQKNSMSNKIKLQSIWANVSNKHSYNNLHIHPGSQVSGVLYIKAPEDSGDIVFVNPLSLSSKMASLDGNKEEHTPYNTDRWYVSPTRGRLILFTSYIGHEVRVNETHYDRMSIAFNASMYDILEEAVTH